MKVKACPRCSCENLGERWAKGRQLEQYCRRRNDGDDWDAPEYCGWVGKPYEPTKRRITNTTQLWIDDFPGWHYIVYDKYGHVQTDSATQHSKKIAMKELEISLKPKPGYDDPAAPLTAVLFFVPTHITIKGKMFKSKMFKGKKK
jgi:hypothetical protein